MLSGEEGREWNSEGKRERENKDLFIPQSTVAADQSNSMVPSKHSNRKVECCNDTH